eukprot:UN00875
MFETYLLEIFLGYVFGKIEGVEMIENRGGDEERVSFSHISLLRHVFFSRTPLRTPPVVGIGSTYGVRNQRGGVRNKSKSGVRNRVRNNCRNPKPMVDGQKLSKLSYDD